MGFFDFFNIFKPYSGSSSGSLTSTPSFSSMTPSYDPYKDQSSSSPIGPMPASSVAPKYVRVTGKNEVYDVSGGAPRHVSYEEAQSKNIWSQIKNVASLPGGGATGSFGSPASSSQYGLGPLTLDASGRVVPGTTSSYRPPTTTPSRFPGYSTSSGGAPMLSGGGTTGGMIIGPDAVKNFQQMYGGKVFQMPQSGGLDQKGKLSFQNGMLGTITRPQSPYEGTGFTATSGPKPPKQFTPFGGGFEPQMVTPTYASAAPTPYDKLPVWPYSSVAERDAAMGIKPPTTPGQPAQYLSDSDKRVVQGVTGTRASRPQINAGIPNGSEFTGTNYLGSKASTADLLSKAKIGTEKEFSDSLGITIDELLRNKRYTDRATTEAIVKAQNESAFQSLAEFSQQNPERFGGRPMTAAEIKEAINYDPNIAYLYDKVYSHLTQGMFSKDGDLLTEEDFQITDNEDAMGTMSSILGELSMSGSLGGAGGAGGVGGMGGPTSMPSFDLASIRNQSATDRGLADLKAKRNKVQSNIDAIMGQFEGLSDEIRNDPDFSQKLKGKRMQFLDDAQRRALTGFQRELALLSDQVQDAEKLVAQDVEDAYNKYKTEFDQYKFKQEQYDKLVAAQEKANDNARAAINTLIQNPNLAKGITDAEINFIRRNGYYPPTLIKKIGANTGTEYKSISSDINARGERITFGVTTDGQYVVLGSTPGFRVPGAGGGSGVKYRVANIEGRRVQEYLDSAGNVIQTVDLGVSGKLSQAQVDTLYREWLVQQNGVWSEDDLKRIATESGVTVKGDSAGAKEMRDLIDNYSRSGGFLGFGGNKSDTPQIAFTDYLGAWKAPQGSYTSGGDTGGGVYTVTSPDGQTFQGSLTSAEVAQLQQEGYTVQ